jgi:hypothetical protein
MHDYIYAQTQTDLFADQDFYEGSDIHGEEDGRPAAYEDQQTLDEILLGYYGC